MEAALVAEIVLTFMFLMIILGSADEQATASFAPTAIGFGLTLIPLIGIPGTNLSVNPAHSTGPALFVGNLVRRPRSGRPPRTRRPPRTSSTNVPKGQKDRIHSSFLPFRLIHGIERTALPPVAIQFDSTKTGLTGHAFREERVFLRMSGPPGGPCRVEIEWIPANGESLPERSALAKRHNLPRTSSHSAPTGTSKRRERLAPRGRGVSSGRPGSNR